MLNYLFKLFCGIEDPRKKGRTKYPLPLILLIWGIGLFKGGSGWKDIRMLAINEIDQIMIYYPYVTDLPSVDTIARTINRLNVSDFEEFLSQNSKLFDKKPEKIVTEFSDNEVKLEEGDEIKKPMKENIIGIAFDGKTVRGATARGEKAHIVNAIIDDIPVAQEIVPDKTNEIGVAPKVIEKLKDLVEDNVKDGTVVITADALLTQHGIINQISDSGGSYLFSLKKNQPKLYQDTQTLFQQGPSSYPDEIKVNEYFKGPDKAHGRIDSYTARTIDVTEGVSRQWLTTCDEWANLRTVACITRESYNCKDRTTSTTNRYYISDLDPNPEKLLGIRLGHWRVETLHNHLDGAYNEDGCKIKRPNCVGIFSTMRKFFISALKFGQEKFNESISGIIKKMFSSTKYVADVLKILDEVPWEKVLNG